MINEKFSSDLQDILIENNIHLDNSKNENNYLILKENTQISNNNHKYKSGQFSFIINSLIKFFSYMFIYFFCLITFLQMNDEQLNKLLIEKVKVKEFEYSKINSFLFQRFNKLNEKLNPNTFLACLLSYIFEPIKSSKLLYLN